MHFGEYELSPSLIGLSPPPTTHPKAFQRFLVRASTTCYCSFTLVMGRSLGFASTPTNLFALLRLAFASAPCRRHLTMLHIVTRRFIMQKARRHPLPLQAVAIGLRLTVGNWFQVLLTPLIGVLFIFHSRYYSLSVVM